MLRYLFVCWGNACRSPMAAGLATKILGDLGHFESAGIHPWETHADPKAIQVMREMGIDISKHLPRSVSSLKLSDYDYFIAMGTQIQDDLKNSYSVEIDKILLWDIDTRGEKTLRTTEDVLRLLKQ